MNIKKFRYSFEAVILILGIIIIFNPAIIDMIFNIFGVVIVAYNVIKFVMGKLGKAPEYPIPKFIVGLLIGISVSAIPHMVKFGIPLVLGCFVLYNGLERLVLSYQIKQHGGNSGTSLIMGIAFALLGIIVIINPFKIFRFYTDFRLRLSELCENIIPCHPNSVGHFFFLQNKFFWVYVHFKSVNGYKLTVFKKLTFKIIFTVIFISHNRY